MKYLIVIVLYFSLAHFGKLFELPHDLSSLFFPAAGMTIAALLKWGPRILSAVFIGSALFIFSLSYPSFNYREFSSYSFILTSLFVSIQAYLGYALARKYFFNDGKLTKSSDVFKFVLYPSLVSPLFSAALAWLTYHNDGYLDTQSLLSISVVWYLGDAIGTAFGLTTFMAIFGHFDTKFNSRKLHVLSYSFLSLIFILFYFLTTLNLETKKEKDELALHSSEIFYRIENEFDDLSTSIIGLRNLIYSSAKVEQDEFSTFLKSFFKRHEGIEYMLLTSAAKDLPVLFIAPSHKSEKDQTLKELGVMDSIYPSIVNGDYEIFVEASKSKEFFFLSLPVFQSVSGKRIRSLEGVLLVKVKTADFINKAYKDYLHEGHRLKISFTQDDKQTILYNTHAQTQSPKISSEFTYIKKVRNFNKNMEFYFTLDRNYILGQVDYTFLITGMVGLFFTILISIVGLLHSGRNLLIYNRVKEHTSKLEETNKTLLSSQYLQSEFIIGMGHELKTAVNSFFGLIGLMESEKQDPVNKKYLKLMTGISKELMVILDNIVDISKIETSKIKIESIPFSVPKLIQEIERTYMPKISAKKIDFEIFKDDTVPEFLATDRLRLKQVFSMLLEKAINSTEEGKIQIFFNCYIKDDKYYLKIKIVDTGVGHLIEHTDSLFVSLDEYENSDFLNLKHTGVAFALCHKIINALGGQISYKRDNEKESSYYLFEVPVDVHFEKSGYGKAIKEYQKKNIDLQDKKVLLVEDNEINQMICNRFFEKMNISYDLAENGKKALEMAETKEYDIILMDCFMPIMDGFTASRGIRKIPVKNPPIIIGMSTTKEALGKENCLKAGMDDYLEKPFQFSDMVTVLSRYF